MVWQLGWMWLWLPWLRGHLLCQYGRLLPTTAGGSLLTWQCLHPNPVRGLFPLVLHQALKQLQGVLPTIPGGWLLLG